MKVVFWLSLLGVFYTYAGYAVIVWAWARLRPVFWKTAPITPTVSIVLAVHNGVALLERKIEHLLRLDYPAISEVIIVSDGSTDGTAEVLTTKQRPGLVVRILDRHAGKAAAVNLGVAEATGEILLFVDIRPEIAPGAIQHLVGNFADPRVGCISGNLQLRHQDHDAAAGAVGGLYWRYEQWLRRCESLVDSPVGVYGGFYAIRRHLFVSQPPGIILDDMFEPLSIIRQGYRSVVDLNAYVYDSWPKTSGAEFNRKVRTLAGNFQLFQLQPWLLTPENRVLFQLVSHKIMRLVVPYLFILLLLSSMVLSRNSRIFAAFTILQLIGWLVGAITIRFSVRGVKWIGGPASALLVLNAAAVVGLYKFLFTRGPLWKIWNPGNSAGLGTIRNP